LVSDLKAAATAVPEGETKTSTRRRRRKVESRKDSKPEVAEKAPEDKT
jgi:hypothetical protein